MALEVHVTEFRARDNLSPVMKSIGMTSSQTARQVEGDFERATRSTERFSKAGFALGSALGSGILLLGEFGRAAAEEEAVFARLEQAVEATGQSYLEYSNAIDHAIRRGEELAFSDDQIADALARMTTTTGDAQAALDNIGLAMDLARARGIDLSTAADLIGRAYTGNFATLARYGIQLDENATATEALAAIQAKTAGQAEAYGNTQAAAIDRAKNSLDNFTESLGAHAGQVATVVALLPGLTAGWTLLSGAAGGITGALAGEAGATGALTALGVSIGGLATAAAVAAPAIGILAYTLYTAKDNMKAVTAETRAIEDALNDTSYATDEFSRRLYGLFSQNLSLVEFTDPLTNTTQTLETTFDELTKLRGEYQAAFIDMARSLEIDFANPAEDDIRMLIDQLLYFYRLQQQAESQQMELNRAAGLRTIVTPVAANETNVSKREFLEIGRQQMAERSVEAQRTLNDFAESAGALESSFYVAITSTNAWSQAQNRLDQQLRQSLGLLYDFATGSRDAGAALGAFKGVQDGLLGDQQVYSQQQSEYQGQLSALENAYTILQERQANGVQLTEEEQALLDNYPDLYARAQGGVEDAAVAQGLLAAQYIENMKRGDELNATLADQAESTDGLTRAIEDMILMMDGVPDEVRTQILLDRADESIADLIAYYNWLNSIPRNITTVIETVYVTGTGGEQRQRGTGQQLHGGVIPGAAHGRVLGGPYTLVGEDQPELLIGGQGALVLPGSATRATRQSRGRGEGGITINGPITIIANDPRQFGQQLREYAMSGARV